VGAGGRRATLMGCPLPPATAVEQRSVCLLQGLLSSCPEAPPQPPHLPRTAGSG
jgi:hypothetical protein